MLGIVEPRFFEEHGETVTNITRIETEIELFLAFYRRNKSISVFKILSS